MIGPHQLPSKAGQSWEDFANCIGVDPDLFFPEPGTSTREAKEVCRGCAVRDECLHDALANGRKVGIWGGMDEHERQGLPRPATGTSRPRPIG